MRKKKYTIEDVQATLGPPPKGPRSLKQLREAKMRHLANKHSAPKEAGLTSDATIEGGGSHVVEEHGFLVLEGELPADAIPDHRDLREERIDDLIRRSFGEAGG